MIQFWVAGVPKAQPRPRRAKNGHFYNPDNGVVAWKEEIRFGYLVQRAFRDPHLGPVKLTLSFVLKGGKTRVNGAPHASKPDTDNLLKAVMDALTAIKVWQDDCQVFDIRVIKRYGEPTGVLITIEEVSS